MYLLSLIHLCSIDIHALLHVFFLFGGCGSRSLTASSQPRDAPPTSTLHIPLQLFLRLLINIFKMRRYAVVSHLSSSHYFYQRSLFIHSLCQGIAIRMYISQVINTSRSQPVRCTSCSPRHMNLHRLCAKLEPERATGIPVRRPAQRDSLAPLARRRYLLGPSWSPPP